MNKLQDQVDVSSQHFENLLSGGVVPVKQFRKATCNGFFINIQSKADCTFSLKNSKDIIKLVNIIEYNGKHYVVGQMYIVKDNLFTCPCDSSLIGIHFVSHLSSIVKIYLLTELEEKFYCMPYKSKGVDGFIISSLLHRE